MKKPFVLTPSEEDLMNIFWFENRPLTSVELTELSKDHGWNQEYILNMLRSIKKKGMVEVCGTVQYNKQYARSFCYCVSRAAYAAKLAASVGIDKAALAETINELVKNVCQAEDTVACVEEVLQELKK